MLEISPIEILKSIWGITSDISALTGERDLNYQVRSEPKRVLKIYPNPSAGEIEFLKLQDRTLAALQGLQRTPIPIATNSGETTIQVGSGAARLLSWLDGQMWAESDSREFAELGRCVALVDQHLARLELTETDVKLLNRDFMWNMMQAEKILNRLDLIADEKLRISVADEITEFKEKFLPKLKEMKSQLIHNDANDWNIVCGEKIQLIDFGDII
ncbi:MAG: phosphotransferase, partial [Actinomycetales bacterium]